MDPDSNPGRPKSYGSYGSGSATLKTDIFLCPLALYYAPKRIVPNFKIYRIFCRERGIKSVSVVLSVLAVYYVNSLYFNPALSQKNLRKQEICQQSKLSVQASSAVVAYGEV